MPSKTLTPNNSSTHFINLKSLSKWKNHIPLTKEWKTKCNDLFERNWNIKLILK